MVYLGFILAVYSKDGVQDWVGSVVHLIQILL